MEVLSKNSIPVSRTKQSFRSKSPVTPLIIGDFLYLSLKCDKIN